MTYVTSGGVPSNIPPHGPGQVPEYPKSQNIHHPHSDKPPSDPSSSVHGIHQHNDIDYHEINTFQCIKSNQLGYTPRANGQKKKPPAGTIWRQEKRGKKMRRDEFVHVMDGEMHGQNAH